MSNFSIFSVMGIEIEYMLVHKERLDVMPKSDIILSTLAGTLVNQVALDRIAISNELVMHVLELKNNGPQPITDPIEDYFQNTILTLQPLLQQHDMMLLPTGAHPWMNPDTETVRWPHDKNAIYNQYDTIFNCQGHGWANLQSMHINLPYANTAEFCQLHTLIRLILPLLPAIAASSPLLDGAITGRLDSRLHFYGTNQQRIPSISGAIIPEFIETEEAYQQQILAPMYQDISPFDPEGILQHQWLNSRAAMPKFDLKAIEIRILDTQECVEADIAIAKAICAILKHWHTHSDYHLEHPCDVNRLKRVYDLSLEHGLSGSIRDDELMRQWLLPTQEFSLRAVWSQLIEKISSELNHKQQLALELILSQGNLSERILHALGNNTDRALLHKVYNQLGHCLITNQQFTP